MSARELSVAETLARVARAFESPARLADTLEAVARGAVEVVPGFEHAGVSLVERKDAVLTLAATDDLVRRLDTAQFTLGEGPCLDALGEDRLVAVPRLQHEQRWPRYVAVAAADGVRAQLSLQLATERGDRAALNLYATTQEEIDPAAPHVAELFAVHAALALGRVREVENLHRALETRGLIGQAVGIVMERFGLDEDHAFGFLNRTSQHSNVKLRDVAARLVEEAAERH